MKRVFHTSRLSSKPYFRTHQQVIFDNKLAYYQNTISVSKKYQTRSNKTHITTTKADSSVDNSKKKQRTPLKATKWIDSLFDRYKRNNTKTYAWNKAWEDNQKRMRTEIQRNPITVRKLIADNPDGKIESNPLVNVISERDAAKFSTFSAIFENIKEKDKLLNLEVHPHQPVLLTLTFHNYFLKFLPEWKETYHALLDNVYSQIQGEDNLREEPIVDLVVYEHRSMKWLKNLYMNSMRKSPSLPDHRYMTTDDTSHIRELLNITSAEGSCYIFLLDHNLKIRWFATGKLTPDDKVNFTRACVKLMGQNKIKDNAEQKLENVVRKKETIRKKLLKKDKDAYEY